MRRWVRAFTRQDEGQDLLEYSLLAGLIALTCVASVTGAGTAVENVFNGISVAIAALPILP